MIGGPTVQDGEIGYALLEETNDLGIHDRAAFDASRFLYNTRVALRPVRAVDCVEPHPSVSNMDLQPIAVVLQLMRPAWSSWRLLGNDWLAWMNESSGRIERPAA